MTSSRRNIMLGTAGHVDHGKSALVKLLTGCETDTLAEEKQRGLTIDLGFAPCHLADKRVVGIVDVPGHVDFIRNMVAGAQGIDVVIFVVAADDGIMPQTHEHLHILTLMGLHHGLVALTKVDLVDAARREFVIRELRRLLANTFLANAPICPISNVTGEGFDGFFDSLNQTVQACEDRPCDGLFRVWVEDTFPIRGAGTVVTGIPTHGRIQPGDSVQLLPRGVSGHVRRMQVYGEDANEGRAGECVALNVPEFNHQEVRRGMVLCEPNAAEPCSMIEAEFRLLESIKGKVEDYIEVQLHVGTAAVAAHIAMLEATEMTAGQRQFVQFRLSTPLPLVVGERFVVRANVPDSGLAGLTTIGGGQILGLSNARLRRKKQWTLDLLAARREAVNEPLLWCEQMLREHEKPVSIAALQPKCWARPAQVTQALEHLRARNRAVQLPGGAWLHSEVVGQASNKLFVAIQSFHESNPHRAGMSREELLTAFKMDRTLMETALASLAQAKQIQIKEGVVAKFGWAAQLPSRDLRLFDEIASKARQGGWSPPSLEDLATALNEPLARVSMTARLLVERGMLVRLDDQIWMHRDAVESAKQTALNLFRDSPAFTTMDFRDALGVSRKYAVPLLDYFDKVRFTVRSGNQRTAGVEAKKLLK